MECGTENGIRDREWMKEGWRVDEGWRMQRHRHVHAYKISTHCTCASMDRTHVPTIWH